MSSPLPSQKQKSISSFFTTKPVSQEQGFEASNTNVPFTAEAHAINADGGMSRKRRLSSTNDSRAGPKRSRVEDAVDRELIDTDGAAARLAIGRTSKYAFSSSPADVQDDEDDDDELSKRNKAQLHAKFVKKLGKPESIAEIKRRNRFISDEVEGVLDGVDEHESEQEDDAEEQTAPVKQKGKAGGRKASTKLTPMETQFLDIKHQNLDTLLVVEVGYKYRFFGEDARIAAKELQIVCIPGKFRYDERVSEAHLNRFASASFPTHRLHVHVKRLVEAGHKVGVVRQLETAALKAVGDNRNAPFTRQLTNLYTKATYIDNIDSIEGEQASATAASPSTGHLLCLTETNAKGWGNDEKVRIGMLAVEPTTGHIIYDEFEDGFMRTELETRFLHIAPAEILLVGGVSRATSKIIEHMSAKSSLRGTDTRIEKVDKPKTMAAESHSHVAGFYAGKSDFSLAQTDHEKSVVMDRINSLTESVTICLSAMISHLSAYGLEHVFDLTRYFESFSARSHMLLGGNTLSSLEIYYNQTDYSERGSLFWTLDRTLTRFGRRLLRQWVGRPLLNKERLEERVDAVEELLASKTITLVDRIKHLLKNVRGDLEKSLIRIYYKRCTRPELVAVLQTLQSVANAFAHVKSIDEAGCTSTLLAEAIASLPVISADVVSFLERINLAAAQKDDKYGFFRDEYETESIQDHKVGIVSIEYDLEVHKAAIAGLLRKKNVEYVASSGIEFLIEIENASPQLKLVPASWIKISGTKKISRFHTPEIVKFIRERDQHKESLTNACNAAFDTLLTEIGTKYQSFRDVIQSLATLDCLCSLAEVAVQPGYVKPTFVTDETTICLEQVRHPMVEQLLLDSYVPNDITLSSSRTRGLLITGPNMGGKSSLVRSVALVSIMAQIGSYVPAQSAKLSLLDAVFTRMGAFDNMIKGESTFMVEISETADIIKQATRKSLVILDELGRGTSTHDGVAIAQAVFDYMLRDTQALTLFITHYQSLGRMVNDWPDGTLKNAHMQFSEDKKPGEGSRITFLYQLGEGMAHRSYGLNVAHLAGLPKQVIDVAGLLSARMESEERNRRVAHLVKLGAGLQAESRTDMLELIVNGIEEL